METLIQQPHLFQSLDFTALANNVTHDNAKLRELVNHYYLEMCKLPGNTTVPIVPYEIGDNTETIAGKKKTNE